MLLSRHHSLFSNLAKSFVLITIIPLCLIGIYAYTVLRTETTRTALQRLDNIINLKQFKIESYSDARYKELEIIANTDSLVTASAQLIESYNTTGIHTARYAQLDATVRNIVHPHRLITHGYDMFVIDRQGNIVFTDIHENDFATSLIDGPYADTVFAKTFIAAQFFNDTQQSPFVYYAPSQAPASFIATPLRRNGETIGILAIQLGLYHLQGLTGFDSGLGDSGETLMFTRGSDENDTSTDAHTHQTLVSPARLSGGFGDTVYPSHAVTQAISGHNGSGTIIGEDGHVRLAAWRFIPHYNWGLVVHIDKFEALSVTGTVLTWSWIALGGILVVLVIAAHALSKSITRPLEELTASTITTLDYFSTRSSDLDQSPTTAIATNRSKNEVAILQSSFVKMVEVLTEAIDVAEESMQAKAEFLAAMSHEIRTPINGIMGMTQLLKETTLDSTQDEHVYYIMQSADSLLCVINDILDFSKIEAGHMDIEKIEFRIGDTIDGIYAMLYQLALNKNIVMNVVIDPTCPQIIIGDEGRMRQVITNLVSNAIKFTHTGFVTIHIHAIPTTDSAMQLYIAVNDTGIGVAADKIDHIFNAFSQADISTTRKYGGTGLGLAISARLATLMGGDLLAASKEHVGSSFTLSLPIDMPTPAPALIPANEHPPIHILNVITTPEIQQTLSSLAHTTECTIEHITCDHLEHHLSAMHADTRRHCVLIFSDTQQQTLQQTWAWAQNIAPDIRLCALDYPHHADRSLFATMPERIQHFTAPWTASRMRTIILGSTAHAIHTANSQHNAQHNRAQFDAHVLLVEDNLINQKVATAMLQKCGCTVTLATNGVEAVALYKDALTHNTPYPIIFMDCHMPEMDGYTATRCIRTWEHSNDLTPTHIIALTANAMEGDKEKCLAAGMTDFLSKPIKIQGLIEKIKVVLSPTKPS